MSPLKPRELTVTPEGVTLVTAVFTIQPGRTAAKAPFPESGMTMR